jgi:hypothetical protein
VRDWQQLTIASCENGEILDVKVASMLAFDRVKHDCFRYVVVREIAGDDLARLTILVAAFTMRLA